MTSSQTSVIFSPPYLQPTTARGLFRVTTDLRWYNSAGTIIGIALVTSNSTIDHACVTPVRACRSYAGYVQTGLNNSTW